MKFILLGRTEILLNTAISLIDNGHTLVGVITCKAASEYRVDENDYMEFAKRHGVPYLCTQTINSQTSIDFTKSLGELDVAVSVNWISVVGCQFIELFSNGVLNAHGGDLPRYRGNACQAWAILNGEQHIGLCIHQMVGGELDNGDILSRKRYPIGLDTRIGEVYDWFEADLPKMFISVVEQLRSDPTYVLETQSKDPKHALRCYPRRPEDGKIDWTKDARSVVRLINASSEPYSGAYTSDDTGAKVTVWRAEVLNDDEVYVGIPGQIASINKIAGSIAVLTGDGKVRIQEIELNGNRMKPSEYFKSVRSRLI
jgi:methionyl-tRNA formyltransferase